MHPQRLCRRRVLELAGLVAAGGLAGCSDGGSSGGDGETDGDGTDGNGGGTDGADGNGGGTDDTDETDQPSGSGTGTPTGTPGTGELDLREANVVGVEFEDSGGSYAFDVTLQHNDDGEEGYANWWQVERLDGSQLGRRDLLHAHSNQPFTRSETIDVPEGVACVVVRGHDQTHGYGGRATLVNLETGATRGVLQGSDPGSFDESDCP